MQMSPTCLCSPFLGSTLGRKGLGFHVAYELHRAWSGPVPNVPSLFRRAPALPVELAPSPREMISGCFISQPAICPLYMRKVFLQPHYNQEFTSSTKL